MIDRDGGRLNPELFLRNSPWTLCVVLPFQSLAVKLSMTAATAAALIQGLEEEAGEEEEED